MSGSNLRAGREAVVREHLASENAYDFDATIATFGHPRYELVATGDWQYGLLSGDFGEAWPDYRWSGAAAEWDDPTLRELSVRVVWTTRGQERDVILTTLVYDSTAGAAATGTTGTTSGTGQ